jgi:hypothetical protein
LSFFVLNLLLSTGNPPNAIVLEYSPIVYFYDSDNKCPNHLNPSCGALTPAGMFGYSQFSISRYCQVLGVLPGQRSWSLIMNTRCIHLNDMHNPNACITHGVSNILWSGSSNELREVWVRGSQRDPLRDMHDCHACQLIVKCYWEDTSRLPVLCYDSERHVLVLSIVSTLA